MGDIGKATAIITRLGDDGPEVCVFDHPTAGTQLPSGSLEAGENPLDGARREALEESGLREIDVRGVLATIPAAPPGFAVVSEDTEVEGRLVARGNRVRVLSRRGDRALVELWDRRCEVELDSLSFDAERHLVHFVSNQPTPDEWWVLTPDGGGHSWRCHWLGLTATSAIVEPQRPWIDEVSVALERAEHPRAATRRHRPGEHELFFAPPFGGEHVVVSWRATFELASDEAVGRAEAVTFTAEHSLLGVQDAAWNDAESLWAFPGGHREEGETLSETLRREVLEEACADVIDHELLGYQSFVSLDGPLAGLEQIDAMYWARAALRAFEPHHETVRRRLFSKDQALALSFWANPVARRSLALAFALEERRR